MSVEFDGRRYDGTSIDHYTITARDVVPAGIATRVEPPSAVADETVFEVAGIPTEAAIVMRAAPDQATDFLLFIDALRGIPPELCELANPANPPSEADCP